MTPEKPSRNEDEYFVKQDAELLKAQRLRAEAERSEAERRMHFMKCPKDGFDLTSITEYGVQIERCPHCQGIWLDAGEIQQIAQEDRPGILGRVVGDLFTSLRGGTPRSNPAP